MRTHEKKKSFTYRLRHIINESANYKFIPNNKYLELMRTENMRHNTTRCIVQYYVIIYLSSRQTFGFHDRFTIYKQVYHLN